MKRIMGGKVALITGGGTGLGAAVAYMTTKAAVLGLTRSLAMDYGRYGIRVNPLCPGWFYSEMSEMEMKELSEEKGITIEEAIRSVTQYLPLKRMAEVDEIAACVEFLASDSASLTWKDVNDSKKGDDEKYRATCPRKNIYLIDYIKKIARAESVSIILDLGAGIREHFKLLLTVPGIGQILALTIMLEVGDVRRFPTVGDFASYARCVPAERLSAGKSKGEGNRKNGNRYLGWAEGALNLVNKTLGHDKVLIFFWGPFERTRGHGATAL